MLLAVLLAARATLVVFEVQNAAKGAPVDPHGLSASVREVALDEVPGVSLMAMAQVEKILEANGEDLAKCEGLCVGELGRKVAADYAIGGRLYRSGKLLKVSFELWSTGEMAQLSGATAEGATPEELDTDVRVKAKKLLKPLSAVTVPPVVGVDVQRAGRDSATLRGAKDPGREVRRAAMAVARAHNARLALDAAALFVSARDATDEVVRLLDSGALPPQESAPAAPFVLAYVDVASAIPATAQGRAAKAALARDLREKQEQLNAKQRTLSAAEAQKLKDELQQALEASEREARESIIAGLRRVAAASAQRITVVDKAALLFASSGADATQALVAALDAHQASATLPAVPVSRTALVDLQRTLLESAEGRAAKARLKAAFDARQKEIDRRRAALRQDAPQVDRVALQKFYLDAQQELKRDEDAAVATISKHIIRVAAEIARRDGYDAVFERASVLDGATDVTDAVIRACDAQ